MTDEDILFLRIHLLVIMARGYLKGYPVGEKRKTAIIENARHVFRQSREYAKRSIVVHTQKEGRSDGRSTHLFCQRVQLLAMMAEAFSTGHRLENYRLQALVDNVNTISNYFAEQLHASKVPFLEVA